MATNETIGWWEYSTTKTNACYQRSNANQLINAIVMIEGDRHSAVVARHLRRRCWRTGLGRQHREQLCTSVQLAGVDSWCDSDVMCSWTRAAEDLLECVTTRAQAYDTTKHNTHNDTERQYTRKIRL